MIRSRWQLVETYSIWAGLGIAISNERRESMILALVLSRSSSDRISQIEFQGP